MQHNMGENLSTEGGNNFGEPDRISMRETESASGIDEKKVEDAQDVGNISGDQGGVDKSDTVSEWSFEMAEDTEDEDDVSESELPAPPLRVVQRDETTEQRLMLDAIQKIDSDMQKYVQERDQQRQLLQDIKNSLRKKKKTERKHIDDKKKKEVKQSKKEIKNGEDNKTEDLGNKEEKPNWVNYSN